MKAESLFRSDSELAEVHPKLASGLRTYATRNPIFLAVEARRVLAILMADMFVKAKHNQSICIYYVDAAEITEEYLCVTGTVFPYTQSVDPVTQETMLLPSVIDPGTIEIPKAWLDTNSPGWQKRFENASALDLPLTECIRSLLNHGHKPSSESLPDNLTL